jgi:hypothetical protein
MSGDYPLRLVERKATVMLSESGFWEIVMVKDAAAAKTVGGKTAEAVFDVAISFLVADEKIASQIKSGLAGLNVFFYPHNQEELVGTNGMESMREPFVSSPRQRHFVSRAIW